MLVVVRSAGYLDWGQSLRIRRWKCLSKQRKEEGKEKYDYKYYVTANPQSGLESSMFLKRLMDAVLYRASHNLKHFA
jgi:hypothetical protein